MKNKEKIKSFMNDDKYLTDELSWNYIMTVIEKCEKICSKNIIGERFFKDINIFSNINEVYDAVINFIYWYESKDSDNVKYFFNTCCRNQNNLIHNNDENSFPYGEDIEYDTCKICGEKHNYKIN